MFPASLMTRSEGSAQKGSEPPETLESAPIFAKVAAT